MTKVNVWIKGLIVLHRYPLQQLALHEGFDHVVRGGEVPGLVGNVDRLETGRERVLHKNTQTIWKTNSEGAHQEILIFSCSSLF